MLVLGSLASTLQSVFTENEIRSIESAVEGAQSRLAQRQEEHRAEE